MTTNNDLSVSEAYERRSVTARRLLQSIERKLRRHAQRNRGQAATWPAVGDLGRVVELLQEVDEFLGDE